MKAPQGMHIGTLIKPHGIRGEMVLKGNPIVIDTLVEGMPLFIDIDGQRVPFFIEQVSSDAPGDRAILKLEFIDSVEDTRRCITREVYSDPSVKQHVNEGPMLKDLLDYAVVDRLTGRSGRVTDYVDQQDNPLLIIDLEGEEIMLPLQADYILSMDEPMKKIVVEFPDGFISGGS